MVNGVLNLCMTSRDFGFEQPDARVEFVDRKRVEVLLAQLGGEVVLATRQVFVCVHCTER
jgi:hypothetical protein